MSTPPLLVTMGDPAGIGPELVAHAHCLGELHDAVVVGEPAVFERGMAACRRAWAAGASGLMGAGDPSEPGSSWGTAASSGSQGPVGPRTTAGPEVSPLPPSPAASVPRFLRPEQMLPLGSASVHPLSADEWASLPWGEVRAECGAEAARCLGAAVRAVRDGQGRAIVTAPIHKEALAAAGVDFPGHTEMLQAWARPESPPPVRMMLANEELRVVLVTIHQSLRSAIDAITFDRVLQTIVITHEALQRWGFPHPRIAVAGLNPHAGEGGLFGREEIDIIAPAIEAARAQGFQASGPHAPDTVFMRARSTPAQPGAFDAVVAMTHDHGLIPVKYLGLDQGVNITLGLPFVRTSPDHGTAFDIAGQGRADPRSFLAALRMARRLS